MKRALALVLPLVLLGLPMLGALAIARAPTARASPTRGLLAPSSEAPAYVRRGGKLFVDVQVASGLTPPPGIQSERALRGFVARLCADGVALGGPARACTPVAVKDVRPRSAHSLIYRAELRVPFGLAPGRYDLELRFPGGVDQAPASVALEEEPGAPVELSFAEGPVLVARAPKHESGRLRLHIAARAIEVEGAEVAYYPHYGTDGTFTAGSVALVRVEPDQAARVRAVDAVPSASPGTVARQRVQVGERIALTAPADAHGSVFWRLDGERSAEGRGFDARVRVSGETLVQGVAIDRRGTARLFQIALDVVPHTPASCATSPVRRAGDGAGLLLAVLCWKLAAGRRRRVSRWNSVR